MKHLLSILLLCCNLSSFGQVSNTDSIVVQHKLSQEQLKSIVLNESKQGGKLDFFTPIKGKEMDGAEIKPGIYATNLSIALYKWGKANFEIGINSVESALLIYQEFKGSELSKKEKDYIGLGFNRKLEK